VSGSDELPDIQSWVRANGDALMRFAYLVTGNHDRAADAVQDALVAACPRWQRIVKRGSPDSGESVNGFNDGTTKRELTADGVRLLLTGANAPQRMFLPVARLLPQS
jgi:hypothetical protein